MNLVYDLFDCFGVIIEEPVECQVESSTQHHGIEEDTNNQDLLWNSDQIIVHFLKWEIHL